MIIYLMFFSLRYWTSAQYSLEDLIYIVLEVLMITKFGWTPGKLLFSIFVKDVNTLKNVTLKQAVIRSALKMLLFVPGYYISEWFLILPMVALVGAICDQRKQFFYDKIAKTVVMDYKSEECNLNYVGIIRRAIACIIDRFIIMGTPLVCLILIITFLPILSKILLTLYISLCFLISIAFEILMIRRVRCTPGQLLCCICIKDANTLKNITLMQATIRCVLFEVIYISCMLSVLEFFHEYISEWLCEYLLCLSTIITIIVICAIFDKRKQFFHDKIARIVVINYIPPK